MHDNVDVIFILTIAFSSSPLRHSWCTLVPAMETPSDFSTLVIATGMLSAQTNRKQAYVWACKIVRDAIMEHGAMTEGTLRNAILLRESIEGMQVKFILVDVPSEMMRTIIVPAFEKAGAVQKLNDTEEAEQRIKAKQKAQESAKRVAAIGDVTEMQKLVHELIEMKKKDDDDKEVVTKRRKQFADNCISLLDRCTRVGAATLRENQNSKTADS